MKEIKNRWKWKERKWKMRDKEGPLRVSFDLMMNISLKYFIVLVLKLFWKNRKFCIETWAKMPKDITKILHTTKMPKDIMKILHTTSMRNQTHFTPQIWPKFELTCVHAFLELYKSPIDWSKVQNCDKELVFLWKIVATRLYISLCFLVLSFCVFSTRSLNIFLS
jgi:hypothetical protein